MPAGPRRRRRLRRGLASLGRRALDELLRSFDHLVSLLIGVLKVAIAAAIFSLGGKAEVFLGNPSGMDGAAIWLLKVVGAFGFASVGVIQIAEEVLIAYYEAS